MNDRTPELQHFLHTMQAAIHAGSTAASPARLAAERIFGALHATPGTGKRPTPNHLPDYAMLNTLVNKLSPLAITTEDIGQAEPCHSMVIEHAQSLARIARQLVWFRRPGSEHAGEPFASGHANATIIGPRGLEERDDIWIGVSLMASGIDYPEHRHTPEEVYVVLSPGQWRQDSGDWHEPGVGGIVYNPPDALHAMRSNKSPLLSTWCLWKG